MFPRRTVDEFILLYQTERNLADIFCEGPSDALIFKFFTSAFNKVAPAVYSADQIEWPEHSVPAGGNRGKIAALSQLLADGRLNGICIIDKDHDGIVEQTSRNSSLILTDYSCLEMYGLSVDDLQIFIYSNFNLSITDDHLANIFDACKHIFAVKYLREKYCAGSTVATVEYILDGASFDAFSIARYLDRCKQLNGYDARWETVLAELSNLIDSLNDDIRNYLNAHDLSELLGIIVRRMKSRSLSAPSAPILKHFSYALVAQRQFGYPLFEKLSTRLT